MYERERERSQLETGNRDREREKDNYEEKVKARGTHRTRIENKAETGESAERERMSRGRDPTLTPSPRSVDEAEGDRVEVEPAIE